MNADPGAILSPGAVAEHLIDRLLHVRHTNGGKGSAIGLRLDQGRAGLAAGQAGGMPGVGERKVRWPGIVKRGDRLDHE